MKKIITIIVVVFCFGAITGCTANTNADTNNDFAEYASEMEKTQEIKINSVDNPATPQVLETEKEIKEFIRCLNVETWALADLPADIEQCGIFTLSQNKTVKLGESKSDLDSYDVMEIYSYEDDSYLTLKIAGLNFDFKIPKETGDYLNSFL